MIEMTEWFESCINQAKRILSTLDLSTLPSKSIDGEDFAEGLPRITAVYFVFAPDTKRPIYIGRASNLNYRWTRHTFAGTHYPENEHHRLRQALALKGATLRWLEVPKEYLGIAEILLIQHYKPKWNSQQDLAPKRSAR
jgi:excinuclease UvrABC nuclease subunit